MIIPHELCVTNEPGEGVWIKLDVNNTIGGPTYYVLEQVDQELFVTLQCLRELVSAAEMLEKTTRGWIDNEQN